YETATSHSVTVLATSSDTSTSSQAFTINVTDINEDVVGPVTDSNVAANTVAEDAINGTVVGITALATDPDGTDTVTYSLSDDAGGLFTIDTNTGIITVANTLDYETATSHSVTVLATSSDTSTSSQAYIINVTDINEDVVGPVTDSNVAANTVAEDAINGTVVGITALATDPDGTATVTYSLSDDAGGLFTIDTNTGIITVANALDYETATNHSVTVLATSSDTSTSSQAFTINVTDINEDVVGPVTDSNVAANSVAEDAVNGTVVGITALATDPDGTDTVTYSLSDDAGGLFTIDTNTGIITVANALDYETATSHSVTVLATSSDTST
ncbi:MAG: cadherin repeat domain-containing protein, partial [Actinomycetia bacterium]|nr:cadherin repeat domain-containing protein [Actinomycetes bacterium]